MMPAQRTPPPSHQGSAGRAATGEEETGREGQAQPGLPTAPRPQTAPNQADIPSDQSDTSYKSDPSDQPALRSLSSEALLAKEDASDERGSDPVQPSPTESDQIQPDSPLNPEPNSTNDPF